MELATPSPLEMSWLAASIISFCSRALRAPETERPEGRFGVTPAGSATPIDERRRFLYCSTRASAACLRAPTGFYMSETGALHCIAIAASAAARVLSIRF